MTSSVPSVTSLNFGGCPSNVAGLIVSVIVNPIYAVFRSWLWTNFFEELFKAIESKFNSFVIFGISWLGVVASLLGAFVRSVFRRLFHAVSNSSASARFRYPLPKVDAADVCFISAVTATTPKTMCSAGKIDQFKGNKFTKSFVGEIGASFDAPARLGSTGDKLAPPDYCIGAAVTFYMPQGTSAFVASCVGCGGKSSELLSGQIRSMCHNQSYTRFGSALSSQEAR